MQKKKENPTEATHEETPSRKEFFRVENLTAPPSPVIPDRKDLSDEEIAECYRRVVCHLTPDGDLDFPTPGEDEEIELDRTLLVADDELQKEPDWLTRWRSAKYGYLLPWFLNQGVPPLHTADGKPIRFLSDIKRMWDDISGGTGGKVTPDMVDIYLGYRGEAKTPPQPGQGEGKAIETPETSNEASEEYDVFLCHASEDKDSFVRPLAQALCSKGLHVWYDEFSLKLGDRLRESIERGLKKSRYGVIVLSKDFFRKKWPREELNGLFSLESGGNKILPVWHEVNEEEVKEYSPILANRIATKTSEGIPYVVAKIIEVVKDP